jgi:BrnA antitoxin of type II toxin-antitoxin system
MRKQYDFSKGKRGAVVPSPGKTRITIMLDDDIIEFFRKEAEAKGTGYQTMINAVLRTLLVRSSTRDDQPLTVGVLRKVLREELHASGNRRSAT